MPPIVVGVDPRWEEMQRTRRDRALADILDSIQIRQERDERKAASAGSLFFENPDLIGTPAWQDWASENQGRFGDQIAIGEELARQRQERESVLGGYYRNVFGDQPASRGSLDTVESGPRDQIDDLFGFTGALAPEPDGIMPGTGPLAPEFWPEGERPSTTPTADAMLQIPENRFRTGLPEGDRALLQVLEQNKKLGVDIGDMTLRGDPAVMDRLQPSVRNFAALLDSNPQLADEMRRTMDIEGGLSMSASQQAADENTRRLREEQERHNLTSETETRRHHGQTEAIGWFNAKKTKDGAEDKKLDPGKFAKASFESQEIGYDVDSGEELEAGSAEGIDEPTWNFLGGRVAQIVNTLPSDRREASASAAQQRLGQVFGTLYEQALQNDPEGNRTAAKVAAQKAIKLYATRLVASSRAGSNEEARRIQDAAFQSALDAVMGVGAAPETTVQVSTGDRSVR